MELGFHLAEFEDGSSLMEWLCPVCDFSPPSKLKENSVYKLDIDFDKNKGFSWGEWLKKYPMGTESRPITLFTTSDSTMDAFSLLPKKPWTSDNTDDKSDRTLTLGYIDMAIVKSKYIDPNYAYVVAPALKGERADVVIIDEVGTSDGTG